MATWVIPATELKKVSGGVSDLPGSWISALASVTSDLACRQFSNSVPMSDLHWIFETDEVGNMSAGFQVFRNGEPGSGTVHSVEAALDTSIPEATQALGDVIQTLVGGPDPGYWTR